MVEKKQAKSTLVAGTKGMLREAFLILKQLINIILAADYFSSVSALVHASLYKSTLHPESERESDCKTVLVLTCL